MSAITNLCLAIILIHSTTAYKIEKLVYNGDGFRPDVHNYLVMLLVSSNDPPETLMCSGSIIDKEWILTAAHCFPDNVEQIKIFQQCGSNNCELGTSTAYAIHPKFIHHPHFNYNSAAYDLALVKTAEPIEFNAYTQLIGLTRLGAFGQQGIIAGYGDSEFGMGMPFEGTVAVNQCMVAPQDTGLLCSHSLAYTEIGDSGGPLTTGDGLVGVISGSVTWSTGRESIYVDISFHFDWIEKVTGKKLHNIGL